MDRITDNFSDKLKAIRSILIGRPTAYKPNIRIEKDHSVTLVEPLHAVGARFFKD